MAILRRSWAALERIQRRATEQTRGFLSPRRRGSNSVRWLYFAQGYPKSNIGFSGKTDIELNRPLGVLNGPQCGLG